MASPTPSASADDVRPLALILSGAVSLGSFESGVLNELMYALKYWWENGGPKYRLDVITGASAGSMTAALVARATFNYPDRASLFHAWVDDIDIARLVKDAPADSILSRRAILDIAEKYLGSPPAEPQPAPFAPKELRMYFSLSNMAGMPYQLKFTRNKADAAFQTVFYADGYESRVTHKTAEPDWAQLRECAIASGNFPLAFSPAYVGRPAEDFPGALWDPFPKEFPFIDGGLFNNEPIKAAVDLARDAGGGTLERGRKFLLVDANLNRWTPWERPKEPVDGAILRDAFRLLTMVRGEASALDWLQAQRRNNEIAWRDLLLDRLVTIVNENALANAEGFLAQLHQVGEAIVAEKRRSLGEARYPATYFQDALQRTAFANQQALAQLGPSQLKRDIYTAVVFILNSIAGLDKKTVLDIDIVFAPREEMAGRLLASFGGFFKREWREHDYKLGRITAHDVLPEILGGPPYTREQAADTPTKKPEYDKAVIDTRNVSMKDTDRKSREAFRDAVEKKIMGIVENAKLGPWGIEGIADFFIKKKVRKTLENQLEL